MPTFAYNELILRPICLFRFDVHTAGTVAEPSQCNPGAQVLATSVIRPPVSHRRSVSLATPGKKSKCAVRRLFASSGLLLPPARVLVLGFYRSSLLLWGALHSPDREFSRRGFVDLFSPANGSERRDYGGGKVYM